MVKASDLSQLEKVTKELANRKKALKRLMPQKPKPIKVDSDVNPSLSFIHSTWMADLESATVFGDASLQESADQ